MPRLKALVFEFDSSDNSNDESSGDSELELPPLPKPLISKEQTTDIDALDLQLQCDSSDSRPDVDAAERLQELHTSIKENSDLLRPGFTPLLRDDPPCPRQV